jgi:hypothetical protein
MMDCACREALLAAAASAAGAAAAAASFGATLACGLLPLLLLLTLWLLCVQA